MNQDCPSSTSWTQCSIVCETFLGILILVNLRLTELFLVAILSFESQNGFCGIINECLGGCRLWPAQLHLSQLQETMTSLCAAAFDWAFHHDLITNAKLQHEKSENWTDDWTEWTRKKAEHKANNSTQIKKQQTHNSTHKSNNVILVARISSFRSAEMELDR